MREMSSVHSKEKIHQGSDKTKKTVQNLTKTSTDELIHLQADETSNVDQAVGR